MFYIVTLTNKKTNHVLTVVKTNRREAIVEAGYLVPIGEWQEHELLNRNLDKSDTEFWTITVEEEQSAEGSVHLPSIKQGFDFLYHDLQEDIIAALREIRNDYAGSSLAPTVDQMVKVWVAQAIKDLSELPAEPIEIDEDED